MRIGAKIVPILILIILVPLVSYGEENTGSLQIDIKYWGGERAGYHGIVLKVYQDFSQTPFKTISLSANPYDVILPVGHKYKIEVYVNSMYTTVGYANLQSSNQKLELTIPIPGSVRFNVVYNDGNTPIDKASVIIKSNDGTYEYWTPGITDYVGNTIRFWLQPTVSNNDYYVADISIGNDLLYSYRPITIGPGISRDIKIVTPWPVVEPLVIASLYKSPSQKISKADGDFVVELYDSNKQKISNSSVNYRGEAYFDNLKVGSYIFRAISLNDDKNVEWGVTNITVNGQHTPVQIFKNQTATKNEESILSFITNSTETVIHDLIPDVVQIENKNDGASRSVIPSWIKDMADWWIRGKISDTEFLKLIEYLVQNKIILIQNPS